MATVSTDYTLRTLGDFKVGDRVTFWLVNEPKRSETGTITENPTKTGGVTVEGSTLTFSIRRDLDCRLAAPGEETGRHAYPRAVAWSPEPVAPEPPADKASIFIGVVRRYAKENGLEDALELLAPKGKDALAPVGIGYGGVILPLTKEEAETLRGLIYRKIRGKGPVRERLQGVGQRLEMAGVEAADLSGTPIDVSP